MSSGPADVLRDANRLLHDGDPVEAVQRLRGAVDELPVEEVVRIVGEAATALGLTALADSARKVTRRPRSGKALYGFGYECVEEGGLAFAAVPALTAALRRRPRDTSILVELVCALQRVDRNAAAVEVLERHGAPTHSWPTGYLLSSNALLAGDADRAIRYRRLLPAPDDPQWIGADHWLDGAVDRLERLRPGPDDLRGWHYVINGGVLASVAPAEAEGMNGRYAWLQASIPSVRHGLDQVRLALEAAGRRPTSVGLLPDRSSTILGLAAADVLDLPARPWLSGTPDCLVCAFDLGLVEEAAVEALADRAPGEVLVEYATCWTAPPQVAADITVLLVQSIRAPWEERLALEPSGSRQLPADPRDAEVIAAEVASAEPLADDPVTAFVERLGGGWPVEGRTRFTPLSPGPVRSSSFRH